MFPIIHIAGFEVSSWRLVVLGGVILCWVLFLARARRLGYPAHGIFVWLLLALPAGTVGGHLFNKLIPFLSGAETASYSFAGLTVIGSIFSCLAFSFLYIRFVLKMPVLPLLDAVAFTFPVSVFIGRFGCLVAGCCYGTVAPDGMNGSFLSLFMLPADFYAAPSPAWHEYAGLPHGKAVWNLPLFLMVNAAFALLVAETLYRNRKRWRLYPGTVIAATTAVYAQGRFLIEFVRMDETAAGGAFSAWQEATFILFLTSVLWLGLSLYKRNRSLPELSQEVFP